MPSLTPDLIEDAARVDPDRTMATSFLGASERARVITLILFAHEIARARATVSEAGLAAIRLQWWRDVVEQIYTGAVVRAQPIAVALAATVKDADLPRAYLDAMIDGYERELDAAPFATWGELETYLDAIYGNFNRLAFLATGTKIINVPIDQTARATGIAWGLARLIAGTPQWSARRSTWLPRDQHEHFDLEALYAGSVSQKSTRPKLNELVKGTIARVKTACEAANRAIADAKLGTSFAVVAPACLAKRYAAANLPFLLLNGAHPRDVSLLERQLRVTLAVARGRI